MTTELAADIEWAANRIWFYEYPLPDGRVTKTDSIPPVLHLHSARRDAMRRFLDARFGPDQSGLEAIDFASHEGYFSFDLAARMRRVRGFDVNPTSVDAATRMARILNISNVEFTHCDVRDLDAAKVAPADLVLVFGLIYHAEDPIRMLRNAGALAKQAILIETQVNPFEVVGNTEFGTHLWLKEIKGTFALIDDDNNREGGTTGLALVPSPNAVRHVLHTIGFPHVEFLAIPQDGPEQLTRRHRMVIGGWR